MVYHPLVVAALHRTGAPARRDRRNHGVHLRQFGQQSAQSEPSTEARAVGPATTDEMAGLHIAVVPVHAEDEEDLASALWGKMIRATRGGGLRK